MTDYTVIGAGAIGGRLAAHLAGRGHRVTVVDSDREHVEAIAGDGIVLLHPDGEVERRRVGAVTPEEHRGRLSTVLLATKAQRTEEAAAWAAERLADDGLVVVCQNGQGHRRAAALLGAARVLPALVNFAADRVGPGTVRIGGSGTLAIGEVDGARTRRLARLAGDLEGFAGLRISDNVVGLLWSKAVLGVLITATALVDDDMVPTIERHRGTMIALARETAALAAASGARLEAFDGIDWHGLDERPDAVVDDVLRYLGGLPGKRRSGVFRDLSAGRVPTEASAELGELLAAAEASDVPAPALVSLRDALAGVEQRRLPLGHTHFAGIDPDPRDRPERRP